jgi:ABC-2 type transport system ATP-binding protein
MPTPSLEAVALNKKYGSFSALTDINLKIEGAKCVGFLGPNGAGKTTTLKVFTNLIKPSSGKAFINGVDVTVSVKRALAPTGALIENPEIYPAFTPREALGMLADIRGIPRTEKKKRIEEVIEQVRMSEWIDKRFGKFSKGMKQRVNIAAALLADPEIILLDEPTTGLDPRGMSEVRDVIKSLKTKNKLIFMSSHLLPEVSDVCDEVAMIDHGKLVAYDKIGNITSRFARGEDVVDVGFAGEVDASVAPKLSAIKDVVSVEKIDDKNLRVRFTGGLSAQERLLSDLVALKIGVVAFRGATSALEDAYLNLIEDSR